MAKYKDCEFVHESLQKMRDPEEQSEIQAIFNSSPFPKDTVDHADYCLRKVSEHEAKKAQLEHAAILSRLEHMESDDERVALVRELLACMEAQDNILSKISTTICNPISMTDAKQQLANIERACEQTRAEIAERLGRLSE